MKKYIYLIFLLTVIMLVETSECSLFFKKKDYFPAIPGSEYIYRTNAGFDTIIKVEKAKNEKSPDIYNFTTFKNDGINWVSREVYKISGNDILWLRREYPTFTALLSPPEKIMMKEAKIGESWSWKSNIKNLNSKCDYRIEKFEKLTFKNKNINCLKLKIIGQDQDVTYELNRWYADGIGLIKSITIMSTKTKKISITSDLKEYKLNK